MNSENPLCPGDLLDEKQAAALLGLNFRTLRNWRTRGEGPRWLKIGKRAVRYRRADLSAFVNEGEGMAA